MARSIQEIEIPKKTVFVFFGTEPKEWNKEAQKDFALKPKVLGGFKSERGFKNILSY